MNDHEPQPSIDQFGGGILNHNENTAHDTAPPLTTTLVSAALGPKLPPFSGD